MKDRFFVLTAAVLLASPAEAIPLPDLKALVSSVNGEYLTFSKNGGSRRIVDAQSRFRVGDSQIAFGVASGTRKTDNRHASSARLSATVTQDWTDRLSTRTSASLAENEPVFANRELLQEVSFKAAPGTLLTVGARYSRYYRGVDVWSWSAAAAKYWRGGMASYRFSAYNIEGLGHSVGHLATFRVDDRGGSSQVWVGHGTSVQDAFWLDQPSKGRFTTLEVSRTQRIAAGFAIKAGVKRAWYEMPARAYHGSGFQLGIVYSAANRPR